MIVNKNPYIPHIGGIQQNNTVPVKKGIQHGAADFEAVLQQKLVDRAGELKLSKHAEMRLQMRNIQLTQTQKEKINKALDKADAKGVRDTLVLMDQLAFVVNVKSRTVITAVNSNELKENVFTNIDGAVIV